ncbi:uncharacterized protein BX664DRAFT_338036 [Halteromyces radiatus]|uniref:uncharacterized protein n=1 Tax=Halteromyces radiatus TaxID=101107 RepID=UPI00221FF236|nr:uncharacterized protein BX664DRAFT_338036 [Halteromyces radiatus]KAI8084889.1 hypothetical protein BX664DRAFT_338036 [Halteromyces radiatus]
MSSLTRNRSHSAVLSSRLPSDTFWISETFECFQVPTQLGEDVVDPIDGHLHHRCQVRYLGPAYLKSGLLPAIRAFFYEVTRSEISELVYDKKANRLPIHPTTHIGEGHSINGQDADPIQTLSSPEGAEALLCLSENYILSQDEQPSTSNFTTTTTITTTTTTTSTKALPPKKRKKRRVVDHCVVFSIGNGQNAQHSGVSTLSTECTYYLFPHDAMVEQVNDMAPFQMFCTFHGPKSLALVHDSFSFHDSDSNQIPSVVKYRTKLEEFAAVCSSSDRLISSGARDPSQRRLTDPGHDLSSFHDSQPINVEISGASADIYYSLKHTSSSYEALCHKMVDLVNFFFFFKKKKIEHNIIPFLLILYIDFFILVSSPW